MSPLPARVGSAEHEVMHSLVNAHGGTWDATGPVIYESRDFTAALLERLAQRGFVETTVTNGRTRYDVTRKGRDWERKNPPTF